MNYYEKFTIDSMNGDMEHRTVVDGVTMPNGYMVMDVLNVFAEIM